MPGQRRLALTSGNVPDFDGSVVAAASDKFAVRRKSDGVDPVIETSQHMKHTGREKDHQKKTYSFKWPVTGHSQTYLFISFKLLSFSIIHLSNKSTFSIGQSHQH